MSGNRIQFVCVCLALLGVSSTTFAVEFAGGTGTPADPYRIVTAEQLVGMGEDPNLHDKHFLLVADIDLDPNLPGGRVHDEAVIAWFTWVYRGGRPYSKAAVSFSGFFDGNQHVIRNCVIQKRDSTSHTGLFASIGEEGIVCELSLEGVRVVDVEKTARASPSCGALAGENSGCIIGCSAEGNIECGAGLVGENSGTIEYSCASATARGGGLVRENTGTIRACYATGNVAASPDVDTSTASFAGGLVGMNGGTISDCYATGAVAAYDYHYCHSGGLVGRDYVGSSSGSGKITRCYATGGGGYALADRGSYWGVLNCYVLRAVDGGGVDNGFGIPLTDAQMRRQESFVGWDFAGNAGDGSDETWMMPPGGGYPVLRGMQAPIFAGSGTADDPYLVEFRYQFLDLRRHPGAHFRLIDDIDLQGRSFTSPVFACFWGHIDGDRRTIGNFTLTGTKDMGLFAVLSSEGSIMNLNLRGIHIMLIAGPGHPYESVGGWSGALVAYNQGKILQCSASTEITSLLRSVKYIGGLVGVNESGEISECAVHCAMMHESERSWWAAESCGGLVGQNQGIIAACHACSYANGDLVAFGALVGDNDGTIANSYADGHLYSQHTYATGDADSFTGGLVGENSGSVINCYAATVVAAPPASGGLMGRDAKGTIASSYFLSSEDGGGPNNGLGITLTDGQMRQQTSFIGWDFEDIWMIADGESYPRLRWETAR
ncbi:MAG: hypothetical protein JW955_07740 [Sedimentisphaerales bacterium]|nr:hypothetical protein [Sedimentisphaerales bacterium]